MSKKIHKAHYKSTVKLTGDYGTINDNYLDLVVPNATLSQLAPIQQKVIAMQTASGVPGAATEPAQAAPIIAPVSGTATVPATVAATPAATTTPAATILPPVANAGSEQDVTLPNNGIILDGSASTDPQGQPLTYSWSVLSGPNVPTEQPVSNSAIGVAGLAVGIYQFQLTVTNTSGLSSSSIVVVNVSDGSAASGAGAAPALGGGDGSDDSSTTATGTTDVPTTNDFSLVWIGLAVIVAGYLLVKG